MAGLVPAIHVFLAKTPQDVDARDERGHDDSEAVNAKGADGTRLSG
jgi:hypothetical protein